MIRTLRRGPSRPFGDLAADPQRLGQRQGDDRGPVGAERLAVEQLHHDVGQARVLADRVDREHVRMLDGRGRPPLPQEPLPGPRVPRPSPVHDLDRHAPVEPLVVRQVDASHGTGADEPQDAMAADRGRHRIVGHAVVVGKQARVGVHRVERHRIGAGRQRHRLEERRARGMGVAACDTDHERAERVAAKHAARLVDLDRLAEVAGEAPQQPRGQEAEPPPRTVDQVQLVRADPHGLEHGRFRPGLLDPDHRVDQLLGVFHQIERPPGGIDEGPGHLHEVGCEELAEPRHRLAQRLPPGVGDRLQERHGVAVGVGTGGQIVARLSHHARLAGARSGGRGEPLRQRLGELPDVEKDQSVHDGFIR
jgi:hypothetical protein